MAHARLCSGIFIHAYYRFLFRDQSSIHTLTAEGHRWGDGGKI